LVNDANPLCISNSSSSLLRPPLLDELSENPSESSTPPTRACKFEITRSVTNVKVALASSIGSTTSNRHGCRNRDKSDTSFFNLVNTISFFAFVDPPEPLSEDDCSSDFFSNTNTDTWF
jgi:hypothetical protein